MIGYKQVLVSRMAIDKSVYRHFLHAGLHGFNWKLLVLILGDVYLSQTDALSDSWLETSEARRCRGTNVPYMRDPSLKMATSILRIRKSPMMYPTEMSRMHSPRRRERLTQQWQPLGKASVIVRSVIGRANKLFLVPYTLSSVLSYILRSECCETCTTPRKAKPAPLWALIVAAMQIHVHRSQDLQIYRQSRTA